MLVFSSFILENEELGLSIWFSQKKRIFGKFKAKDFLWQVPSVNGK
jgi:hypothetical protein